MHTCPRCSLPRRPEEMIPDRNCCRRCKADYPRQTDRARAALRPRKERTWQGERVRAWKRASYCANRERIIATVVEWQRQHPDQVRAKVERRRSLQGPGSGAFTSSEFQALCARYAGRCLACAAAERGLTVDHVVPLTQRGTNCIENVQPLCGPCNCRKRNRTIDFRTEGLMFSWCPEAAREQRGDAS
jgi:5-methylcytosine-specific restriction endonuclease McrA